MPLASVRSRVRRYPVLLVGLAGLILICLRRPDALTNPQFFAEDGKIWFQQAYNDGPWRPFGSPYSGYLVTLPRIFAVPAVRLGIVNGALLCNIVGAVFQLLPALFLASRRGASLVNDTRVRVALACAYLLLPVSELHVSITNALWHLALLAILMVIAAPPATVASRIADSAAYVLCGLSGPFAFALVFIAAIRLATTRLRWYIVPVSVFAVSGAIQAYALTHSNRAPVPHLDPSVTSGIFIVANRLAVATFLGTEAPRATFLYFHHHGIDVAVGVAFIVVALELIALWKGPEPLRLFLIFGGAIAAAGLIHPDAAASWPIMASLPNDARYFFIAQLGLLASAAWLACRLPRPGGAVALTALAAAFLSGLYPSPQYAAFPDSHPDRYDAELAGAPPGTVITIPITPPGWSMRLVKHP